MFHILFVDDEDAIREGFAEYAQFLGYEVTQAKDGMEAVALCRAMTKNGLTAKNGPDFDVIVMDIMMPRMDGFTACQEIRRDRSVRGAKEIPVLMLSARGEEYDKLHGFSLGIDDYVTKPFSSKEVLARLGVLVRRGKAAAGEKSGNEVYRSEGLVIDFTARTVEIDGVRTDMTPKEYDLLFYLARNRNIALSREKLLSEVWGYDFYGDDSTVNTHIKVLRQRLGPYGARIVTIRGVGYRFE